MRHRLIGALRLQPDVYGALRADRRGWGDAVLVVLAVAISHGFGALFRARSQPYAELPPLTFLFGFQGEVVLWLGMSASLYAAARTVSRRTVSFGQVARPLGVAALPGIGVVLAGAMSGMGLSAVPVLVLLVAWRAAASFVAVKQGLATTSRAAGAWLLVGLVGGVALMAAGTALLNAALQR